MGTATAAWPPVSPGASIRFPGGPILHIDQLDAQSCAAAEAHLLRDIASIASRLRVRLADGIPPAPLDLDQYHGTADVQAVGELHHLVSIVRAVRAQREILRQREAERAAHEQYRREAARSRFLAEARPALEKIAGDLAGLPQACQRIDQLMQDIRLVMSANELVPFAQRLHATAHAAGVRGLPTVPTMPADFDPLPAIRQGKAIGVLPIRIADSARTMANEGRAAIEEDQS